MKYKVPERTTHLCLDGVYYPVEDGVVEVPDNSFWSRELERLGYKPVAPAPIIPPGMVFELDGELLAEAPSSLPVNALSEAEATLEAEAAGDSPLAPTPPSKGRAGVSARQRKK
jgi:hypothetical protein